MISITSQILSTVNIDEYFLFWSTQIYFQPRAQMENIDLSQLMEKAWNTFAKFHWFLKMCVTILDIMGKYKA